MPTPRSAGEKPKVTDRRYLRPDEARRLIEAAGKRGRYPFRDRVLLRLVYRHGLRASEAVGMRWSQLDLERGWNQRPSHIAGRAPLQNQLCARLVLAGGSDGS